MLFNIYQYYANHVNFKNEKLHILTCLNIFLTYYFIQNVSY